jgi:hypothetical protein
MITENYNYTYEINSISIENGTFVIRYIPEDTNLTPVSLNQKLFERNYLEILDANNQPIYSSQNDVPFSYHLDHTVKITAPLSQWRNQYLMTENIEQLTSANGSFSV